MHNSHEVANTIKVIAKSKNIAVSKMLFDLELNKNTLYTMQNRGSWIQADSLAKIADYLGVSVDYLLGLQQPTTLLYGGDNPKKREIADILNQSNSIPDNILDLVIAALKPYK